MRSLKKFLTASLKKTHLDRLVENVRASFSLGNSVTMNAFQDVVGPTPEPATMRIGPYMSFRSQDASRDIEAPALRDSMVNEFDDLEDDQASDIENI